MIRFRTIDPADQDKPAEKPVAPAKPAVAASAPAGDGEPAAARKGLTRKTPLRAKKAGSSRSFKD
ncbi:hypothetical protein ASE63_07090 [Bosea sp. Root381]|uniref:hypothetical protein n=1 Tax=Bosea sp. Root381 TaxID=1736524 RepID=UPI0006FE3703|nr:hypothetical protein [Bosea sp. Root381]KRE02133.1 hypothetical protein ASE63_07090 [Bosea sp. Root381]